MKIQDYWSAIVQSVTRIIRIFITVVFDDGREYKVNGRDVIYCGRLIYPPGLLRLIYMLITLFETGVSGSYCRLLEGGRLYSIKV